MKKSLPQGAEILRIEDLVPEMVTMSSPSAVLKVALENFHRFGQRYRGLELDLRECRRQLLSQPSTAVQGRENSGWNYLGWCLIRSAEIAGALNLVLLVKAPPGLWSSLEKTRLLAGKLYSEVPIVHLGEWENPPFKLCRQSSPRSPASPPPC